MKFVRIAANVAAVTQGRESAQRTDDTDRSHGPKTKEIAMAKGQMRSTKEAKKPKKEKPKTLATSNLKTKGAPASPSGKK